MNAIVLVGGYVTRLWPITRHRPKMLLPLGETTVIDRIYAELESEDRIEEVYVSTNERFAPDFEPVWRTARTTNRGCRSKKHATRTKNSASLERSAN
ncbi:nucleotidyl transferase [Natronococcus amylolyticus DSM 10524]|uniref:Nucleotidyl transferase n=1 Tax=Natronococcus amylolyticus DSM 10524 TaxID=1227497 RepID=L9X3N5_9EURY|nr:nucleotidyl transferase [Natronococcus amylolyticus DSM 10524]